MNLTTDSLTGCLSGGVWIVPLVCVLSLALLTVMIIKVSLVSVD